MNRFLIDVHVGALETVNRLLGIAHDKNLVENGTENIPLQLVCVLKFVNDGVCVLCAEPALKQGIALARVKCCTVHREYHVVKRLAFLFGLVLLPFVKNACGLRNQEVVEQNAIDGGEQFFQCFER